MEIRINTAESGPDEYTALIALLASLGGRLPAGQTTAHNVIHSGPVITNEDRRTTEHAEVNQGRRGPPTGGDEPAALVAPLSGVDSAGTPWDERIHSSSKERNKSDDTWRKRRGVSDETFGRVMEEIRAAISDGSYFGHESTDEDAAPPPPPADDTGPLAPSDDSVPVPPAPTEETPSEPEPAASAPADGSFPDFASFVAAVAKHGKTYAELNEMAGVVGVAAFKDLKDHADKWDMFFSMIG